MRLLLNAVIKFTLGLLSVGLLIFLPAGTLDFKNGWLFITLLFVPMLIMGGILFFKAPELLKKRLDTQEKQTVQKSVVAVSAILFLCGFVLAGLDFRFAWSDIPVWLIILASCVLLASYALYAEVMRENAYLSRAIKVEDNQKVIDTGLYGIVRHPMYAATTWMFLSIPIVLGSWFAIIPFAFYPIIIAVRILNEEKVLEKELKGYNEYKKKVKYRLIPFVW